MKSLNTIHIKELNNISQNIEELFYIGNQDLLNSKKISIVGSRKPNSYTKLLTHKLSYELSKRGITIISGAAMGVDAIAHNACHDMKTIAVVANGLHIKYPSVNKKLIEKIEKKGLMLSQFEAKQKARNYTFVQRNELVVALGEILIITQADLNSGSLRSAQFAKKLNKQIYVLPHRLNESLGTQALLKKGEAKAIYDVEEFVNQFGEQTQKQDDFIEYCKGNPTYEEAFLNYEEELLTYELEGRVSINNGYVTVV